MRIDDILLDYLMDLVRETREDRALSLGVSPRGGIHLFRATQAAAILSGRTYPAHAVALSDITALLVPAEVFRRLVREHEEMRDFVFTLLSHRG